jgi:hypothetical protein
VNTTIQAKKLTLFALTLAILLLVALGGALTLSRARPAATEGAVEVLTNEEHGYSLRYPTGYDVQYPNEHEAVILVSSLLDVEQPRVHVEVQDAGGRTVEQAADELVADLAPIGWNVERSNLTIDGEEAVVLNNVPGQDISRQVLVVHRDRLYKLTFVLVGGEYGEVYSRVEALYITIINSFKFLPAPVACELRFEP